MSPKRHNRRKKDQKGSQKGPKLYQKDQKWSQKGPKCHQNGTQKEAMGPKRSPKLNTGGLWDALVTPKPQNGLKGLNWGTRFWSILAPKWHQKCIKNSCLKNNGKKERFLSHVGSFWDAKMEQKMYQKCIKQRQQNVHSLNTFYATTMNKQRNQYM